MRGAQFTLNNPVLRIQNVLQDRDWWGQLEYHEEAASNVEIIRTRMMLCIVITIAFLNPIAVRVKRLQISTLMTLLDC